MYTARRSGFEHYRSNANYRYSTQCVVTSYCKAPVNWVSDTQGVDSVNSLQTGCRWFHSGNLKSLQGFAGLRMLSLEYAAERIQSIIQLDGILTTFHRIDL